ncbi:helix-turn-helix domain-containing protein [Sphingobium sp. V4]|uniref:TetR/AcrR family transcriptional regulator n=1 Tax=Sphingobium sp. V4 TaxID=3038927 RepID=UPI002557F350|nr:TetR/AcrR family transcriptional regulator [Sphingobium sp. V4]WIW89502.1 helix-turn-helix domain-containing protein [Sphingobium sp. V4]
MAHVVSARARSVRSLATYLSIRHRKSLQADDRQQGHRMSGLLEESGRSRAARAAATRDSLLRVARTLFEERGYFEIGTPELVVAAGVTRGALYHHFGNKFEIFKEVFLIVEQELFEEALSLFEPSWITHRTRLRDGSRAYLTAVAGSAARQRIMLIDGPAVLGWEKWRYMQSASFRDLHERNIRSLMDSGEMRPAEPQFVSRLLIAALNEAALAIAHAQPAERDAVRIGVTDSVMLLIDGLLLSPPPTGEQDPVTGKASMRAP